MAGVDELDEVLERFKLAANELLKGNPKPVQNMFSHREDVSLANPFGPPVRGWEQVAETIERAASIFRDGEMVASEEVAKYVTPEPAYTVWLEPQKAKVGGRQDIIPFTLRVTMVFRPEDGEWKIVHRHADPITTAQPADSILQE